MIIHLRDTENSYVEIAERGIPCEVPDGDFLHWNLVLSQYKEVQSEMFQAMEKGKLTMETVIEDSSRVVPRHSLAAEVQKATMDDLMKGA